VPVMVGADMTMGVAYLARGPSGAVPVADPTSGLGDGSSDSAHRCGLSGDTSLPPPHASPDPSLRLVCCGEAGSDDRDPRSSGTSSCSPGDEIQ
jgi:hypothetical protein